MPIIPIGNFKFQRLLHRSDGNTTSSDHCLNWVTSHNGLHLHLCGEMKLTNVKIVRSELWLIFFFIVNVLEKIENCILKRAQKYYQIARFA